MSFVGVFTFWHRIRHVSFGPHTHAHGHVESECMWLHRMTFIYCGMELHNKSRGKLWFPRNSHPQNLLQENAVHISYIQGWHINYWTKNYRRILTRSIVYVAQSKILCSNGIVFAHFDSTRHFTREWIWMVSLVTTRTYNSYWTNTHTCFSFHFVSTKSLNPTLLDLMLTKFRIVFNRDLFFPFFGWACMHH